MDEIRTDVNMVALKNVLALAEERLWLAEGKPTTQDSMYRFDDLIDNTDIDTSRRSIHIITRMLDKLRD